MKKNFITGTEFSNAELKQIIKLALSYKANKNIPNYKNKILTLIFANPSLRTRLSFESGMKKMQGQVNVLNTGNAWEFEYDEKVVMNKDKQEHIKEAAAVISKYTDLIALRKNDLMTKKNTTQNIQTWQELKKDQSIKQLAKYSDKPIINMESNMFHPCQSMADMMTITEKLGEVKNKKCVLTWAPHPKPLPLATPHSQLLTPAIFGMNVTLTHPPGFDLDADVIKMTQEQASNNNGQFSIILDQKEAFKDADVIIAKSWASLKYFGKWEKEKQHRKKFNNWIINQDKMNLTNKGVFLHCLPARRNVVVSDLVIDSKSSLVIPEAENRMWIQMAIISQLLKIYLDR